MTIESASPQNAARLIYKGLQTNLSPANDIEYRELLGLYSADTSFQDMARDIAKGLDLSILDVTQDWGIVLVPASGTSRFALRLTDIRQNMTPDAKAGLVLAHIAVAAAFFPTTDGLDDDNYIPPPVAVAEFRDSLVTLARRLKDAANAAEAGSTAFADAPAELRPGWEAIVSLPVMVPGAQRATPNSVVGLVRLALLNMTQHGLVRIDTDREDDSATYTPTHRYRVQLRELTLKRLFEFAQHQPQLARSLAKD